MAQKTNAVLFKTSLYSQVDANNLVKVGLDVQVPAVSFGEPGHLAFTTNRITGKESLERYDTPRVNSYQPLVGACYAQDQLEWQDLTLRAGLRMDYFDARSTTPLSVA